MSRGSDTRERIVAEARRLFARKGYGGATMAEIARRVHITQGAIYRHFASKEELFMACVAPALDEAFTRSLAEVEAATELRSMARALVEVRLELIEQHLDTFDILFGEGLHRAELQDLLYQRVRTQAERVGQVMEWLRRAGRLKRQPNLLLLGLGMTAAMWAMLRFQSEHADEGFLGRPVARERLVEDLTAFVLHGVAGEPAGGEE